MAKVSRKTPTGAAKGEAGARQAKPDVPGILATLRAGGDRRISAQARERFGIDGATAATALGWPVGRLRALAKSLRGRGRSPADADRNHALAMDLWATGQYEARLLAAFIGEPALLTTAQMNRWAADFDNWATCDTACFGFFDRAEPRMVFGRVRAWAKDRREFVRRGAFALLASAALHRKDLDDAEFEAFLPLIERHAVDERNFVKKGVSWALRGIGKRSPRLRKSASATARRLAASDHAAARWVGQDALRDFGK